MSRSIVACLAVALAACATSPKQLRLDSTPGQLTLAGAPGSRGPDAVWGEDRSPGRTRTVHFHTGTATIDPASYALLDETAETLKARDVKKVIVEGHTDSSGGEQLNSALSQHRAEAVRAYLVSKGVDARRLEAKGFGATRPAASNATEQGREANRRVDFVTITSR